MIFLKNMLLYIKISKKKQKNYKLQINKKIKNNFFIN